MIIQLARPNSFYEGKTVRVEDPASGHMRWWTVVKIVPPKKEGSFTFDTVTLRRAKKP